MFYQITEGQMRPVKALTKEGIRIGVVDEKQLSALAQQCDISAHLLAQCRLTQQSFHPGAQVYDRCTLCLTQVISPDAPARTPAHMALLVMPQLLLIVCSQPEVFAPQVEALLARFTQHPTLEKTVFGVLDALLEQNAPILEKTEQVILNLEQKITDGPVSDALNGMIYTLRRRLAVASRLCAQTADLSETLAANENELFESGSMRYFRVLTGKAQRMGASADAQRDNLAYLRESLDASLNYSINRTMKFFTMVTTLFAPLTLIVGWYGMNFEHMPELGWRFGYPAAALVCVGVGVGCLILFKKKKLF